MQKIIQDFKVVSSPKYLISLDFYLNLTRIRLSVFVRLYLADNSGRLSFVGAPELQRKKCILDLKHNESVFQFRIFQILNRHSDRRLKSLHG